MSENEKNRIKGSVNLRLTDALTEPFFLLKKGIFK